MSAEIILGYVVGTGERVSIPLRHTAVTGQTQESGKTTTLEGLISRSGLQAVAYVTKRGESSFHVMNPIPPYFQERADWKFVQSLLEASTESKLKFEQSWIMRASEGARTLQDVRANIQRHLTGVKDTRPVKHRRGTEVKERWVQKPARGLSGDIYYVLNKYLDDIMPQLAELPYSTTLELAPGLNVMDLRDYEFPLQSLVVRSVLDWTRLHGTNTINLIPEAWKFAPKQKGSPVRQSAEELIREGGALKNFLWIDSQDLAGVADVLMRQVGVWLFGVQRAKHEIERALDHMPEGLPSRRPRPADIATLQKGQFYVCYGREMHKVYVQPAWMTAAHAEAIARGEEDVDSAREILRDYADEHTTKKAPVATKKHRSAAHNAPVDQGNAAVAVDSGFNPAIQESEDETVWKERFEALEKEYRALLAKQEIATTARKYGQVVDPRYPLAGSMEMISDPAESNGHDREPAGLEDEYLERVYDYIKKRAAEDPGVLQLLRERPEIRVNVKRRTIEMNDAETPGRLALLIAEKFFDVPQTQASALKEFKRRGWTSAKSSTALLLNPMASITESGFLIREGTTYQAVPGMKVNIVESAG